MVAPAVVAAGGVVGVAAVPQPAKSIPAHTTIAMCSHGHSRFILVTPASVASYALFAADNGRRDVRGAAEVGHAIAERCRAAIGTGLPIMFARSAGNNIMPNERFRTDRFITSFPPQGSQCERKKRTLR